MTKCKYYKCNKKKIHINTIHIFDVNKYTMYLLKYNKHINVANWATDLFTSVSCPFIHELDQARKVLYH